MKIVDESRRVRILIYDKFEATVTAVTYGVKEVAIRADPSIPTTPPP
jgi:hypothetical protein